jgi:hypothetical protein
VEGTPILAADALCLFLAALGHRLQVQATRSLVDISLQDTGLSEGAVPGLSPDLPVLSCRSPAVYCSCATTALPVKKLCFAETEN